MTNPTISQSQKRFNESVGALFAQSSTKSPTCLFLKSSTDIGVMRNGGRNGARLAPRSFLSTFKKFSQSEILKDQLFVEVEVSSEESELGNFHEAQLLEAKAITQILNKYPHSRICHLGGGHDHVYPLLKAISEQYQEVVVINIDAHADTRTDTDFHSGTPFRQFADGFNGKFHLFQIGLHPFANSFSTMSELNQGDMEVLWMKDFSNENLKAFFKKIQLTITDKTFVLLSIDADALNGHEVPGVSAVNPAGLSRADLLSVWSEYLALPLKHKEAVGIYELNPVYDTLASISMRTMASFVFETFR